MAPVCHRPRLGGSFQPAGHLRSTGLAGRRGADPGIHPAPEDRRGLLGLSGPVLQVPGRLRRGGNSCRAGKARRVRPAAAGSFDERLSLVQSAAGGAGHPLCRLFAGGCPVADACYAFFAGDQRRWLPCRRISRTALRNYSASRSRTTRLRPSKARCRTAGQGRVDQPFAGAGRAAPVGRGLRRASAAGTQEAFDLLRVSSVRWRMTRSCKRPPLLRWKPPSTYGAGLCGKSGDGNISSPSLQ